MSEQQEQNQGKTEKDQPQEPTLSRGSTECPPWDHATVTVDTKDGRVDRPAIVHPWCPGIAVTMHDFGVYRATHILTGKALGGYYERLASAIAEAANFSAIFRALGVDVLTVSQEDVAVAVRAHADDPVPFPHATSTGRDGKRPLTIAEWIRLTRSHFACDDYPWEAYEDSPQFFADEAMRALGAMHPEGAPVPAVDRSRFSPTTQTSSVEVPDATR
jgi:hypothetical protein